MGYSEYVQTWQMKHGLNTEVHAKAKFKQIFKKLHKNCTFKDPGITIYERFPFIFVSPDLEVCCSCHGKGLVEIKCPATLIGKIPNSENYSTHIEQQNYSIYLKKSSPYYSQIQGQMGVKNIGCCYFFVFTFQGFINICVNFDKKFRHTMLERLNWFWRKYVAQEMLTSSLKEKLKKVYYKNDIIFIERESTHAVSEHALSGN